MSRHWNIVTGASGEALARKHLESRGYETIERNWRCAAGELDIVMRESGTLVFVEVRTRFGEAAGAAEESVSRAKASRLLAAAEWYVAEHPDFADDLWRIDLLAITFDRYGALKRISHFPNAIVVG
jgi:putative endonuclease